MTFVCVFSLESCAGEHEPSVRFLISFPYLYFSAPFFNLWGTRFGLDGKIFDDRRRLATPSGTRLSLLRPSTAAVFPPRHVHGSSPNAKCACYAGLLPHALPCVEMSTSRVHAGVSSLNSFVANLLDPIQSIVHCARG